MPKRTEKQIRIDRLYLDLQNPRHEPFETQAETIHALCGNEQVPQLARDIAKYGISPLDRFGVVIDHQTNGDDTTYVVAEGNRRLCALKLLTDPASAPGDKQEYFESLAEQWTPILKLPCVIFDDEGDLDVWLKRRHHGPAGGIGQKAWNADQKARNSGTTSRNRVALGFLDYAEKQALISATDRQGKLTTVQRFLGNPEMRATFGIDVSDPNAVQRTRTPEDFRILSERLIADMLAGNQKVHSRKNKAHIEAYARELETLEGLSGERVEPAPLSADTKPEKPTPPRRPRRPRKPQWIPGNQEITTKLIELGISKLQSLYYSICNVRLRDHTPLLAVGVWSFLETLTAAAGRTANQSFPDFLSNHRLINTYGLGDRKQVKPLHDALRRIADYGNATKHHDTAAAYNADQLINDMESLGALIVKVIDNAIANKQ